MVGKSFDIAIVGIGAKMPIGLNGSEYWQGILNKKNGIIEIPKDAWDIDLYYDPDPKAPDKSYSKIGGFVRGFEFDRKGFRLPPSVVKVMDSTQQLGLAVTQDALADANLNEKEFNGDKTAVILGNALGGDQRDYSAVRAYYPLFVKALHTIDEFNSLSDEVKNQIIDLLEKEVKKYLVPINEDTMPGELANCIAGRIANVFNLKGANYTVDAACASSLAAMSAAVKSLRRHECDVALSGGIDRSMAPAAYIKFCKIGALSGSGSRPYDAKADGFVMGEGGGIVILKRLEDAVNDGNKIYAVIKNIGTSSDGRGKGITAPNTVGMELAVRRGYEDIGMDLSSVDLIEGHGTSTRAGDGAELETIANIFSSNNNRKGKKISIGSVKSQIGHLKSAAGAAGVIKAAMALYNKILPPTINFEIPNDKLVTDIFKVQTEPEDWEEPKNHPRRAGISSFGFGGTNFHLVLEEYNEKYYSDKNGDKKIYSFNNNKNDNHEEKISMKENNTESTKEPDNSNLNKGSELSDDLKGEIFAFGADSKEELKNSLLELKNKLAINNWESLVKDYHKPISKNNYRITITTNSQDNILAQIDKAVEFLDTGKGRNLIENKGVYYREKGELEGKLAFLFPGQGSQWVGMLQKLSKRFKVVADTLQEANEAMFSILNRNLTDYIFGEGFGEGGTSTEEALQQTTITQPAMVASDVAILRLFATFGLRPEMVGGHSLGEYAAGVAAGVFNLPEAMTTVAARGREMANATPADGDPGWMAAISASCEDVEKVLKEVDGYVITANKNCSTQTIIAGRSNAVKAAMEKFKQLGIGAIRLPVSHAFHSAVVSTASGPLKKVLEKTDLRRPSIPMFSNVTGELYPEGPNAEAEIIDLLSLQVAHPVEFIKEIENMYKMGARFFVEIGPKKALSSFVSNILENRPHRSYFTNHPKKGDIMSFLEALATVTADGYEIDLDGKIEDVKERRTEKSYKQVEKIVDDKSDGKLQRNKPTSSDSIVITGVSMGLPGSNDPFSPSMFGEMVNGRMFIEKIPDKVQKDLLSKNIVKLVKKESGEPEIVRVKTQEEVIHLAGRGKKVDLVNDYGIPQEWIESYDPVTVLSVASAIEALRDAALPFVPVNHTTKNGKKLTRGFKLADEVGKETGVIFGSAFPGYNRFAEEIMKFSKEDKSNHSYSRHFLVEVLGFAHAQLAQLFGAFGPNLLINTACASTTTAISIASDWIKLGRCRRVIIIGADDVTSDVLLPWIGGGFLASGAATTKDKVEEAALPFDKRRHGMILGMGAVSLVVESSKSAEERGIFPLVEVMDTRIANSGYHAMRLHPEHISEEMEKMICNIEKKYNLKRKDIASKSIFMSHETYTPARGGSAQAEVDALRRAFGDEAKNIIVANSKGYTGHPMGAGIEETVVIRALETQFIPPIPNYKEQDPELGFLNLSQGKKYDIEYGIRIAAGFGSQVAMCVYHRLTDGEERLNWNMHKSWLQKVAGINYPILEISNRTLKAREANEIERQDYDNYKPQIEFKYNKEYIFNGSRKISDKKEDNQENEPKTNKQVEVVQNIQPQAAQQSFVSVSLEEVQNKLIEVVCEKSGYDKDEVELDYELEADLGIDTVKQAEIMAKVRENYGLARDDTFRLTDYPTMRDLSQYIYSRVGGTRKSVESEKSVTTVTMNEKTIAQKETIIKESEFKEVTDNFNQNESESIEMDLGKGYRVYGVEIEDLPFLSQKSKINVNKILILSSGSELSRNIQTWFDTRGIESSVVSVNPLEALSEGFEDKVKSMLVHEIQSKDIIGVLNILALEPVNPNNIYEEIHCRIRTIFHFSRVISPFIKEKKESFFISLLKLGGFFGIKNVNSDPQLVALNGSFSGFTKSLAREWENINIKAIDFNEKIQLNNLLEIVMNEAGTKDNIIEIGYPTETSRVTTTMSYNLTSNSQNEIKISSDMVLLITGGAGGITTAIGEDIIKHGIKKVAILDVIEHKVDNPQDINIDSLRDKIKEEMKNKGEKITPVKVDAMLKPYVAAQRLAKSLQTYRNAGAEVSYHKCDLGNVESLSKAINEVYSKWGRVDGVIHAAGVEISKPIEDKDVTGFDIVFKGKALGAIYLWSHLKDVKFFVSFSSVAGRFGNAGQVDYGSANDVIAKLGWWARNTRNIKALTTDWTAWDQIGMASNSAMKNLLQQRGVDLLPPDLGVPLVYRLLSKGINGEVVVCGRLGNLASPRIKSKNEPDLDPDKINEKWFSEIKEIDPGKIYEATLSLETSKHLFLNDHQIDGTPVLPGVIGIDLMVKSAQLIFKDKHYLRARAVFYDKPVKLYHGNPTKLIITTEKSENNWAKVRLESETILKNGKTNRSLNFSSELLFADNEEIKNKTNGNRIDRESIEFTKLYQPGIGREEIYKRFFHGPSFQVLDRCVGCGEDFIIVYGSKPSENLVSWSNDKTLTVDPLVVEMAFQSAGLWNMMMNNVMSLPHKIKNLHFYKPLKQELSSVIRAKFLGEFEENIYSFVVEVLDENGDVLVFIERVDLIKAGNLPEDKQFKIKSPVIEKVELDLSIFNNGINLYELIESELMPQEREIYSEIKSQKRQREWLGGRIAAKRLVCTHLRDRFGIKIKPEEVEIVADPFGAPYPRVISKINYDKFLPDIAITHSNGHVIVVAAPAALHCKIGIDLEIIEERDPAFNKYVLTEKEENIVKVNPQKRNETITKLWTIKEVISKTLGLGLKLDPREIEILEINGRRAKVELNGLAETKYDQIGGKSIEVYYEVQGNMVLTWGLILLNGHGTESKEKKISPLNNKVVSLSYLPLFD